MPDFHPRKNALMHEVSDMTQELLGDSWHSPGVRHVFLDMACKSWGVFFGVQVTAQ